MLSPHKRMVPYSLSCQTTITVKGQVITITVIGQVIGKDSERSGHGKDSERSDHGKDSDRSGHGKDSDRSGHDEGSERSDHGKDSDRSGHGKDSERSGHGKDSERSGHDEGSERSGHGKDSERSDHGKDSDRSGHGKDRERSGHDEGSERSGHDKDSERSDQGKDSERSDHGKDSERSGHDEDSERSDQGKDSERSDHGKDSERLGHDEDSERSGHDEDSERSDHGEDSERSACEEHPSDQRPPSADESWPLDPFHHEASPPDSRWPPNLPWGQLLGASWEGTSVRSSAARSTSSPALMYSPRLKMLSISSKVEAQVEASSQQQQQRFPVQCLRLFLSANPSLEHLRLQWAVTGCESTSHHHSCQQLLKQVLEVIGECAPGLKHLAVKEEDPSFSCLDNLSVSRLLHRCTHLQSLDMSGDSDLTDEAFEGLQNNRGLERLSLSPFPITLTTPFFVHPPDPSQLRMLDLTWCGEVQEEPLMQSLTLCPFLTTLKLRLCKVTSRTLRIVAQHCTAVQCLDIAGAQDLEDEAVVGLAQALTDLTSLDLSSNCDLGDDSVRSLLTFCPHLETLNLSCLPQITSLSFVPMVTGGDWEQWIPDQVRSSTQQPSPLSSHRDMHHQLSRRWSDLRRSSNYGSSLRGVDLSYCNNINDSSMRAVVTVCRGGLQVMDYYKQAVEPYNNLV
ncbi:uncharacterized protein LOC143288761 [Babylonia areolata]|uniref:uncharacterized protein LOC143288761 n=1 Tax=Babylonia areolata TaxID=304850 RepID=UPI003FD5BA29